jgi:membrane protease YdiL (CAAX protease family)
VTPGLLDHAFVILVIGLIFPLGGWYAYQLFLRRLQRDGAIALVHEYRNTMIWLFTLGLAAIALWAGAGRPLAGLGFAPVGGDGDFVTAIALGAGLGLILRPVLAARSASAAAALRKQFGSLEAFLPRTKQQLAWGLAVSVFAGLFEEIAYRGYLIAYFQAWLSDWGALAASSVLFGLAHLYQGKLGLAVTTLLGAGLGWIYLETGSLLLPVLLHALVDISSMVTAWIVLRPRAEA